MPISLGTSQPAKALESGAAKLWVLLVGVNHYQAEALPSLQYPAPDCQGLAQALTEATQNFPSKELCIYHDFADQPPTLMAVRKRLQEIAAAAQSQDTVLIYFSGHGVFDAQTQQVVLCLSNTRKRSARYQRTAFAGTVACTKPVFGTTAAEYGSMPVTVGA